MRGRAACAACVASSKRRARSCARRSDTSRRSPISPQAIGSDEKRLGKTIVRINTIESTSPFSSAENVDEAQLPAVLVPAEPERPDMQYERDEVKNRVRNAIATLPPREQRVIALYYYNEVTMKDIGAELGVNESRVSQLHARAIRRLREALGAEVTPVAASAALRDAIAAMEAKPQDGESFLAGIGHARVRRPRRSAPVSCWSRPTAAITTTCRARRGASRPT